MRVTTKEAAKKLGIPEQSLRLWMIQGTCPFGSVMIDKRNKYGRRTYYICKERLERYIKGEIK